MQWETNKSMGFPYHSILIVVVQDSTCNTSKMCLYTKVCYNLVKKQKECWY